MSDEAIIIQEMKDEIRDLRNLLYESLQKSNKDMEKFKDKIGRKAMMLAREHQWCGDVQNALRELNIPIPDMTETIEITVKFELTGIPHADLKSIDKDYLTSCIDYAGITLDSEWGDVEEIDYEVVNARIVPKGETR